MPVENLEEQGLEKNPNLELAQWKYLLSTDKYKNNAKLKTNLLKAVEADSKLILLLLSRSHDDFAKNCLSSHPVESIGILHIRV